MIGAVLGIIFLFIVIGVLWWAAKRLLALIPLEEPFRTIVYVFAVLLLVVCVLWALAMLLSIAGIHVPYWTLR